MKAIMMSIRPEWCELIFEGKKTIEVRKTAPNIKTPFKCYIYETHDKRLKGVYKVPYQHSFDYGYSFAKESTGSGKVIGEFICNAIDAVRANNGVQTYYNIPNGTCLTDEQLIKYAAGKMLYLWHISAPIIYDTPKKMSEFYLPGTLSDEDFLSALYDGSGDPTRSSYASYLFTKQLRRPPQSWCYVEGEV